MLGDEPPAAVDCDAIVLDVMLPGNPWTRALGAGHLHK